MSKNSAGVTLITSASDMLTPLNRAVNELSDLIRGMSSVDVAGTGSYTLLADDAHPEARKYVVKFSGVLTGARSVLIPTNEAGRVFIFWNATTGVFALTVKTTDGASTGVVVGQGKARVLFHDGVNVCAAGAEVDVSNTPTFTAPTLLNSWVNNGSGYANAGYTLYQGMVVLRGTVKNGTVNTTLFTLPVGYRPSAALLFAVQSNLGFGAIEIQADGDVVQDAGVNTSLSLDGIRFLPV